jgi:hypothetical protein
MRQKILMSVSIDFLYASNDLHMLTIQCLLICVLETWPDISLKRYGIYINVELTGLYNVGISKCRYQERHK